MLTPSRRPIGISGFKEQRVVPIFGEISGGRGKIQRIKNDVFLGFVLLQKNVLFHCFPKMSVSD